MKTIGILGGMGRFNPQRASYTSSTRFVSKSHNCCFRCFNPKRASYTSSTQEPSLGTMLSKSFNPKRASYTSSTSAMEKSFEAQRAVSIPNGLPTLLPRLPWKSHSRRNELSQSQTGFLHFFHLTFLSRLSILALPFQSQTGFLHFFHYGRRISLEYVGEFQSQTGFLHFFHQ